MDKKVKYGLLGHPLGHSFSRKFHTERFERLAIDAVYENFDLPDLKELPDLLAREPSLRGLNVTIPYKQAVMAYLDELDPLAERIGAVNTIRVELVDTAANPEAAGTRLPGLRLKGYNTDIIGFCDSLRPLVDEVGAGAHHHALVLGTGGASRAVMVGLADMGIEPIAVSRTPSVGQFAYADLTPEVMARCTVVVNCTPLGMYPNVDTCPDLPYHLLTPRHVCFDVVYNPAETTFMRRAADAGARVAGGYGMLVGQALASYDIWTAGL